MKTIKLVNGITFINDSVEFPLGAEVSVEDSVADYLLGLTMAKMHPISGDETVVNYFEEVVKEVKSKKPVATQA